MEREKNHGAAERTSMQRENYNNQPFYRYTIGMFIDMPSAEVSPQLYGEVMNTISERIKACIDTDPVIANLVNEHTLRVTVQEEAPELPSDEDTM